jgi:hypothetical protein
MESHDWADTLGVAITVCDRDGIVVAMNERSKATFAKDGGGALVGRSLFGCHGDASSELIRALLAEGRTNAYTIEKNGVRKLIYQTPWRRDGEIAGLVELSLPIPAELPHYVRE